MNISLKYNILYTYDLKGGILQPQYVLSSL